MLASLRCIATLSALTVCAASPAAGAQSPASPAIRGAVGEIRGRLVEQGSERAITGGSVTVRRAGDTTFAGGTLPRPDGTFRVDGLVPGRYTVRIRALGYAPVLRSDITISAAQPMADLGVLALATVAAQLEGQVVTAEREEVELAPDRNSYSTKNMTTASGGTAVDVLRNVPSVEVDGSNKVSLRGNENVVVQINGRTSPLRGEQLGTFLAQLPSSTVKNVEVSTNPSAKNDPEGTAGIINIVLNQEAELGLSGGFSAGTGTTRMANLSANVGRQRGPLTLFLSGSFYRDSRAMNATTSRTNLVVPIPAFVESTGEGAARPMSGGLTFRSEYRFTERDALSFDAFGNRGQFRNRGGTYYTDFDEAREEIGFFDQRNDQSSSNNSQDYTLAFRRTGTGLATTLNTELRYSRWDNTNESERTGTVGTIGAGSPSTASVVTRERDRTLGSFPSWNLQADYMKPFSAATKLETGFKGTARTTRNDFVNELFDNATAQFAPVPTRAVLFDYEERIAAGYAVLSQRVGKVQAQAGLRLEQATTRLDLPSATQRFDQSYGSAFPSGILTYNFSDLRQAKLSYSRRISRPSPFQLSPVEYRQDARSVFRGNPELDPEYTDAWELGLQESRAWGSVQLNPYVRRTANAVRHIQTVDASGITVGSFANVASTLVNGADLNVTYRRGSVTVLTGGSAYHYSSDATNLTGNLSTDAFVWSARLNLTWKLSAATDIQSFANYRAPQATEGGRLGAFVFTNLAVRQKVWGEQGNISLRLADPFNLMKFTYRLADGRVIESQERRFQQRGLFVTVTRSFGQQLKLRPRQQDAEPQAAAPTPGTP
jgi:ferric enterobactin receptor